MENNLRSVWRLEIIKQFVLLHRMEIIMLTGKQRAQLRALANTIDTVVIIGKGGITDTVVKSVEDALKARELVKGKVLENALLTAREACDELARLCGAESVQAIGSKFVLYKENKRIDITKRIKLVK